MARNTIGLYGLFIASLFALYQEQSQTLDIYFRPLGSPYQTESPTLRIQYRPKEDHT